MKGKKKGYNPSISVTFISEFVTREDEEFVTREDEEKKNYPNNKLPQRWCHPFPEICGKGGTDQKDKKEKGKTEFAATEEKGEKKEKKRYPSIGVTLVPEFVTREDE